MYNYLNYFNYFNYECSEKKEPREVAYVYTDCYSWCPWW